MGLPMAPMIQPQAGFVSVDVPRENSEPLTLGEVWRLGAKNRPDSSAAFPMGMAIDGSIFWADLTDPNMTGILVGGASGSGKSVFLRAAVIGLALNAVPEQIGITLIKQQQYHPGPDRGGISDWDRRHADWRKSLSGKTSGAPEHGYRDKEGYGEMLT